MKKLLCPVFISLLLCCQVRNLDITESILFPSTIEHIEKFGSSNDLELLEPDYQLFLLAEGLDTPEGVIYHPPSEGLLLGQSRSGEILLMNRIGELDNFGIIPPFEGLPPALTDLLFDPKQGVFAVSIRHRKIFLFDKEKNRSVFADGLLRPLFIEMDHKHNLFVSDSWGRCITKIDEKGNKEKIIDMTLGLGGYWIPRGIVFDQKELLYVLSDWRRKEIRSYQVKGASEYPIRGIDGKLIANLNEAISPQDITIGFDGDLFVVGEHNIWRVKINGNVSKFASGLVGRYNTIHVNSCGQIMATDYGNGKVYGISKNEFKIN